MKGIIIYGTVYGSTKRYAQKLSQLTGWEVMSYDKVKSLSGYDAVVHLGGLYAGGIKGLKTTVKNLPNTAKLIVVTVGLADPDSPENCRNLQTALERQLPENILERTQSFHLRGAIDYEKLHLSHKMMMALLIRSINAKPSEQWSDEDRMIVQTYNQKVDFVNFEGLRVITEAMRQIL